jgi:hypothetical protein
MSVEVQSAPSILLGHPIDWPAMGVFTDDQIALRLVLVFFGSAFLLFFVFKANEWFMQNFSDQLFRQGNEFAKLPEMVKKEYYSRNASDFHSLIAIFFSVYSVYYACDNPEDSIFTSMDCLMSPKRVQLYLIAFSSGYCLYDIYVCLYEIKFTVAEAKDYIFHHVVGILGACGVILCGRFTVALSAGNLVSELSNGVMNIRWRMLKHKQTEHWSFIPASIAFMICFFFSRVVFMLMLIMRLVDAHR